MRILPIAIAGNDFVLKIDFTGLKSKSNNLAIGQLNTEGLAFEGIFNECP
jgi:hypothetical protein